MTLSPKQREALKRVADGKFFPSLVKEEDGWHARWRAIGVENGWVDEYVREANLTRLSEDAEDQKHETLHDAWMLALRSRTGLVRWEESACAAFAAELEAWSGNAAEDRAARQGIAFTFAVSRLASDVPAFSVSCPVPKGRRGLKALGQAAYVWGPLVGLRSMSPAPKAGTDPQKAGTDPQTKAGTDPKKTGTDPNSRLTVTITRTEAEDFLRAGARNLHDAGYVVEGVDLAATITASAEIEASSPGDQSSGQSVNPSIRLVVKVAGEPVTADEIRFLLDQGSTLVYFRDHWIEVDRGILKEALRALEKGVGKRTNALGFAMGLGHVGQLELDEVKAHGWLRGLVNELRSASTRVNGEDLPGPRGPGASEQPKGFVGELRDYQKRGVKWLTFLTEHGFGALLADDMGLGKTIQVIAWILNSFEVSRFQVSRFQVSGSKGDKTTRPQDDKISSLQDSKIPEAESVNQTISQSDNRAILIVAPLTLLSNWRHEFAKFAPALKVYVHQGESRHLASGFRRAVAAADVTLTSYNLLVRDYTAFSEIAWRGLVLDEAQAVKNPDTQVARAVRALTPAKRIAMTGTPIENSVADIWSLEEFLNPGFLGDRRSFADRFVKPIAADENSAAGKRLRHALEPFILRRLKSDARIAAELGEKREIREYCELSPEQRRDYETALGDFRAREHAQGDVFALLTELKLICDGAGKLERLCELVGTIFENGESALVFTQYAKVGAWLREELFKRFGRRFPFLHGTLSAAAREAEIAKFNRRGPNLFILSLKAGGFGLNLTKATHVVHFDRWWNPAVENQATDRAHRIGQTKTVFVHLFISSGTLEEHVDVMLEKKSRVAGSVITEAEWLEAAKLD